MKQQDLVIGLLSVMISGGDKHKGYSEKSSATSENICDNGNKVKVVAHTMSKMEGSA